MRETLELVLSEKLRPICPRDNHRMKYEAKGIHWKAASEDCAQTMASYLCNFEGCGVRYDHMNGYFTIVHETASGFAWRCGVEGCTHTRPDVDGL